MLEEEAKLIHRCIAGVKNKTILNIGSSDEKFYKKDQPHIWKYIMEPLIRNNNKLINFDKKKAKGVDVIGDATTMIRGTYDIILFCNCIEHIKSPFIKLINNLYNALNDDGVLIISAPGVYPIHKDPIDNEMRFPNIKRWVSLFEFYEDKFKIIEYCQTKEMEAPVRYGFREMVYSSIVKCVKNKKLLTTSHQQLFETDYLLLKLKEIEKKDKSDQNVLKSIKLVRLKLDVDGILSVKLMLKNKTKIKGRTDSASLFYKKILGVIRQSGALFKEMK